MAQCEIRDLKQTSETSYSEYTMLKHEKKALDEELTKLKQWYFPKLKKTKEYQKEIAAELDMIRNDAELLPQMFRHEAVFRTKCKQDKENAEDQRDQALKQFEKLKKEKEDLKHELERKERLALQAIAARSNMKKFFDDSQGSLKVVIKEKEGMQSKVDEA
jgi:hypothetical protein